MVIWWRILNSGGKNCIDGSGEASNDGSSGGRVGERGGSGGDGSDRGNEIGNEMVVMKAFWWWHC